MEARLYPYFGVMAKVSFLQGARGQEASSLTSKQRYSEESTREKDMAGRLHPLGGPSERIDEAIKQRPWNFYHIGL
jgi:hypothetical protein